MMSCLTFFLLASVVCTCAVASWDPAVDQQLEEAQVPERSLQARQRVKRQLEEADLPWYMATANKRDLAMYAGSKRTKPSRQLVTFQCTRKTASCKNGGKGPRVTFLKGGGAMCACMCPFGYHEVQCNESWWNSNENDVLN